MPWKNAAAWDVLLFDRMAVKARRNPISDCRRKVGRKLRELGAPCDMDPHTRMAANIILSACRQCGRCERGL